MKRMLMMLAVALLFTGCTAGQPATDDTTNSGYSTDTTETSTPNDTIMPGSDNDANAVLMQLQQAFATLGDDLYAKEFDKVAATVESSRAAVLGLEDPIAKEQLIAQIDQIEEFSNKLQAVAQKCSTDQMAAPVAGDTVATINTNKGAVKVKLFTCDAPETTKNFITHANNGFYDGVVFHRVIKDFMIQGGDPDGTGMGGYSYKGEGTTIDDEFSPNLKNLNGTLSMANSGPNTNGSQFFIVQAAEGTPWLDFKHSVFGQVYEGMDVVNAIADMEVDGSDRPTEDVMIESIEISTL